MTPLGSPPAPSPLLRGTAQQDLAFLLGQLISKPQALVAYLENVGKGKALRQLAREMGVYPSTVMRWVRWMEDLRDHPYADFLLANWVEAWTNNTTEGLDLGASWVLKSILIQAAPEGYIMKLGNGKAERVVDLPVPPGFKPRTTDREAEMAIARAWQQASVGQRTYEDRFGKHHKAAGAKFRFLDEFRGISLEMRAGFVAMLENPAQPPETNEYTARFQALRRFLGDEAYMALFYFLYEDYGTEQLEKKMGWSARSAKVVMRFLLPVAHKFLMVRT